MAKRASWSLASLHTPGPHFVTIAKTALLPQGPLSKGNFLERFEIFFLSQL